MRRLLLILSCIASAGALTPADVASAQAPSQGSIGIRLVDAPVSRKNDPRASIYIIDHVQPGDSFERRVEVSNNSDGIAVISLYATSASVKDGAFVGAERGDRAEPVPWTSVRPSDVELQPGARQHASVRIAVPANASGGERYGVIWAEIAPPQGTPIRVVNRVGVRMYLSVGGKEEPLSDFVIRSMTAQRLANGKKRVAATVENTGGRALDLSGELRLADGPSGLSAGPFPAKLGTTLGVGQVHDVTVDLDEEIPDGPWRAQLALRSGELERKAEAMIKFPERPGTSARPVKARAVTGTIPGIIATGFSVLLLLLLGGWLLWFLLKRRRRKADDEERPAG